MGSLSVVPPLNLLHFGIVSSEVVPCGLWRVYHCASEAGCVGLTGVV